MPDEMVRETKEALGWDPDAQFLVPGRGLRRTGATRCVERGAAAQAEWQARFDAWAAANAELAAEWNDAWAGKPRAGLRRGAAGLRARGRGRSRPASRRRRSCRRSARSCRRWSAAPPTSSTRPSPSFEGEPDFTAEHAGRNVAWGVREHGDGRGGQRPRAARRDRQAVLLDVLRLHRLHAPADPALGADEARLPSGSSATTRSRSARTARRTSRSSTSRRCARSRT